MFTGIVERSVEVLAIGERPRARRLTLARHWPDVRPGESIAVNGCCLTIAELSEDGIGFDVIAETLSKTNLGLLRPGDKVHVERAMAIGGRIDGHFVQGHVDGTGEFLSLEPLGSDHWWLRVRVPPELDRYLVYKGSVAIDGISLTVAALEAGVLSAAIVPHTYANTNLRLRRLGERVNIECDIVAKYLEKLLASREGLPEASRLTLERLREMGY